MIIMTHRQIEIFSQFVNSIESDESGLKDTQKYFSARLTESKFVYAMTLRYPTTEIDSAYIKYLIKNHQPTVDELQKVLDKLGVI